MFRMFRTGVRVKRVDAVRGSISHNRPSKEQQWRNGANRAIPTIVRMHPATDSPALPVRFGRLAAVIASMVALATAAALLWIGSTARSDAGAAAESASGIGMWGVAVAWFALAAVLAFAAGLAGASLARNHMADALREARVERQSLAGLLDVWQWRSDFENRLTRLVPPSGASASDWLQTPPASLRLWERFEGDPAAPGVLRESALSQAPITDLPVSYLDNVGTTHRWLLRGTPRFDAMGRFAGYVGTARPVVPPFDAQWLQSVVAAMPGAVVVGTLGSDGNDRVVQLNTAACELLGVDGAGSSWDQMLSRLPADIGAAARSAATAIGRADGGGAAVGGYELRLRKIEGSAALQLLSLTPLPTAAAETATSDHEAFSYTVSHDLRAPIRVVEGFTRIVKEDYGRLLDKIGVDHLDRVLGAASRMSSMIDALLDLSQLSARPLASQPVNLSQLAGFVIEDLRRNAPERSIDVHIEGGMSVQGDPTLLRIVLENLLGNAWKYTAKVRQARIWFESTLHDGRAAYLVRDNGAGFDMRFADRLFGVFQRLHSASDFEGTGVGLASVQRIVRRHGGQIWAESEVNRGASFYFTLRA
jgi:signal transduction histidine kinase